MSRKNDEGEKFIWKMHVICKRKGGGKRTKVTKGDHYGTIM